MPHAILRLLSEDHARLDALLEKAARPPGEIDLAAFDPFRRGLLRHIAMEEKVLLPAARRVLGEQLPDFLRLRADHGRFTLLMVPTPTRARVEELKALLAAHNELEERDGGVYQQCVQLLGDEADEVERQMREYPEVPVRPYNDARPPKPR